MSRPRFGIEANAPETVNRTHVGLRILYRMPNQAVISEGTITELSPGGSYFRVGRAWIANRAGAVLSVLPSGGGKRTDAFEGVRP